jgi:hypothetical protein
MTAAEPLVVTGGTVAALIAAEQAAAAGREVELLLPHKGVGGGFAPLHLGGRRLDRGLRALELRYEGVGAPPPLAVYDPAGAGHRPYSRLIEAYVRDLVGEDLVELDRPRQWLAGRLGDELLTTCDLTGLRAYLTDEQADTIAHQASGTAAGLLDPRHAGALQHTSIADASREQHGALFHDLLIAPLAAKLRPEGGVDVPAVLRRKLWLALFHPRTLREAAGGGPVGFCPDRPFHGIEPGGTGAIVARLLERVQAAWRITVRRVDGIEQLAADGDHVLITPAGGAPLRALDPILALPPGELFAATGIPYLPDRVTSVLAWVEVAEADVLELPSFLHVIDADVPVFRFSRGERREGRVTVCAELAHDVPKGEAAAVAAAALVRLGLVREGAPVTPITAFAGPTFTAPTFANRERFSAARAAYDARGLRAQTIGGGNAFAADSLNEQLVQALQAAELAAGRHVRAAA